MASSRGTTTLARRTSPRPSKTPASARCTPPAEAGLTRLLDEHAPGGSSSFAATRSPWWGFSDVTALHAVWSLAGVRSIHGAMVLALGRRGGDDELVSVLEGATPQPWTGLSTWTEGPAPSVRGRAMGGNLSLIAALQGTPSQLPLQDSVLFLEDVGEAPYRIDRMLTSLRSSGALRGVRAVVLGEFTRCDTRDDGVSVERVLRERLSTLGVPVLAGAPFGHGDHHRPWVQGAEVTVRRDGEVIFEEGLS
ncbi:MAG: LD-carboxypeptidase [Deltaproteobacteria bacterium]|nr:LD-carboxypeptidase [Deltaproteobacteria bacterium]